MKIRHLIFGVSFAIPFLLFSCKPEPREKVSHQPNVLIFSKTKANRHECIEPGVAALQGYFKSHGMTSTHSEDTLIFTAENLKPFDAVMFFQTSGNVLGPAQEKVFQSYIRSGKGFAGIHAAADTEYDWPWYGQLTGAYFADHPDIQTGVLVKTDSVHACIKHLPVRWSRTDEWYNFKQTPKNVQVLLKIDEATYHGGVHGADHPMAWCHVYDGGRAFYTALGHTVESYKDTLFLEHIRLGVLWAANKL